LNIKILEFKYIGINREDTRYSLIVNENIDNNVYFGLRQDNLLFIETIQLGIRNEISD